MKSKGLHNTCSALACFAILVLASSAFAEIVIMKAEMNGESGVPPTTSKGTGLVTATFDTNNKKLSWTGSYKDLSGPATAAHFHFGELGKNGSVEIPISPSTSPLEGSATLTDDQATELLSGKWYVNIHTDAYKAGEIRGQLTK
jgi:hypothetical protein